MFRTAHLTAWVYMAALYLGICLILEQRHHARHNDAKGT
jgi:hypothetical protein